MYIKFLRVIVDRIDKYALDRQQVGGPSNSNYGVLQQAGTQARAAFRHINRKAAQQCHRNRIGHVSPILL